MNGPLLLVLGSALILLGIFVLIEAVLALNRGRRTVALTTPDPAIASDPYGEDFQAYEDDGGYADDAPPTAPAQEDLEMIIVGERETNPDGIRRQDIIRQLHVGDPVELIPEADDPDGRNEIKVNAEGGTIGYLPPSKVPRLLDLMSEGAETQAEISHIATGNDRSGVWVSVSVWR